MPRNRNFSFFWRVVASLGAASVAVTGLVASEHHGVVQSGGLAVPGATITATHGDQKVLTTTDGNGAYSFSNLEDGIWTLQVSMLGFAKATKEIGIAPAAPSAQWELKFMSLADIKASMAPPAPEE